MRTLRICLCEIVTALALLGIAYVCLVDQMLLPFARAMLIGFYVLVAAATEAAIIAGLRPARNLVIAMNILVAGVASVVGWTGIAAPKVAAVIAVSTLVLRLGTAGICLRASPIGVRRWAAAAVGSTLLLATLATAYSTVEQAYSIYYVYPRMKEGYILPTRWQDFLDYAIWFAGTILLFYVCYRLLKYAFRRAESS